MSKANFNFTDGAKYKVKISFLSIIVWSKSFKSQRLKRTLFSMAFEFFQELYTSSIRLIIKVLLS
jgi:hypothetical protein